MPLVYKHRFRFSLALLVICLSFTKAKASDPLADGISNLIKKEDKIRDAATAAETALATIPGDTPMKNHFAGHIVSVTKSASDSKSGLKKGDVVWIVEIINNAISDLYPAPEGIYYVKAKDGKVFRLAPQ